MSDIVKNLQKKFGKEIVVTQKLQVAGVIPTGSLFLDKAIGVGGYPIQKITEIFGAESVGKSTMCLHAAKMAQQQNKVVVYIDAEYSLDTSYAETIGVDTSSEKFIVIQPYTAEQSLEAIEEVLQYDEVGLVILDSVAAMVPSKESYGQGEVGDTHVGGMARLMSQFSRRIVPVLSKSSAALILINQIRDTIATMGYGGGKQTPGGHALKHLASIRIQLSRKAVSKDQDIPVITIEADVRKNKVAPPYSKAEINIISGMGVDVYSEIIRILIADGLIVKSGSWYKDIDGNTIGQGTNSVRSWISTNLDSVRQVMIKQGFGGYESGLI